MFRRALEECFIVTCGIAIFLCILIASKGAIFFHMYLGVLMCWVPTSMVHAPLFWILARNRPRGRTLPTVFFSASILTWLGFDWLEGVIPKLLMTSLGIVTGLLIVRSRVDEFAPLGFCTRCRYDLTGNTSGRCPECGNVVPASGTTSRGG